MNGHDKSSSQWQRGKYTVISIWLAGLVMVIFTELVLAADYPTSLPGKAIYTTAMNDETPYQLTVADNTKKEGAVTSTQYNPTVNYPGIFKTDQLYRRNPDTGIWMGSKHPAHLKQVACPKAKAKLSETGSWSGHLNKDGSCGTTAEPADWVLGNLLNFQESISSDTEVETE